MKITVFDVGNASCSLVVCPNGNSMMIDCGSHGEKDCPVDLIGAWRQPNGWLSNMKNHVKQNGKQYPLTRLSISHPDDDHIRNAQKVKESLTPYLLSRRRVEEYPQEERQKIDSYYQEQICKDYRGSNPEQPDWGFSKDRTYHIPMADILADEEMSKSIKNNSSRVQLIEGNGLRIFFGGDMEEAGWKWLLENDSAFKDEISNGVHIYVTSHHGHVSGYSPLLVSTMGAPMLSILSKGSETGEDTDVSSSYSSISTGVPVKNISNGNVDTRYSVSTRANGIVFIEAVPGEFYTDVEKGF